MSDLIGYIALCLNLYSMHSKREYKLRLYATIANVTYVIYVIRINSTPLIIGCCIATFIHLYLSLIHI